MGCIKKIRRLWHTINDMIDTYESIDDCIGNLDTRVNELEIEMDFLSPLLEPVYDELNESREEEPPIKMKQLTIYEFIDELPF